MNESAKLSKEVCAILEESYTDFVVNSNNDFLSFATVIDLHLSAPQNYTDDENCEILDKLYEILDKDRELLNNIGWDIPDLLMEYFPSKSFFFVAPLANNTKLRSIFKTFDLLARHGNAKELFLKACEILESLSFQDDDQFYQLFIDDALKSQIDDELREKTLNLKFHTIFELLNACFKRITTLYPSKFLLMIATSVLKYFNNNVIFVSNSSFTLRRIYTFARDYIQPQKPMAQDSLDAGEAARISQDEDYLQGKVLQYVITHGVEISCKYYCLSFSTHYYNHMVSDLLNKKYQTSNDEVPASEDYSQYKIEGSLSMGYLLQRIYDLALSYDIDVDEIAQSQLIMKTEDMFTELLQTSVNPANVNGIQDQISERIFDTCTTSFVKSLAGNLDNTGNSTSSIIKGIPVSYIGCFMLYSFNQFLKLADDNETSIATLNTSFKQLVFLSLRYLVPIISIQEQIKNKEAPTGRKKFSSYDDNSKKDYEDEEEEEDETEEETENKEEKKEREEKEEETAKSLEVYYSNMNSNFRINRANYFHSIQDIMISWSWFILSTSSTEKISSEISSLTKTLTPNGSFNIMQIFVKIYLQCLISITQKLPASDASELDVKKYMNFKKIVMTYVIRLLSMSDELFSWDFVMSSLENCPYLSVKVELINVLKDLCIRRKVTDGSYSVSRPNSSSPAHVQKQDNKNQGEGSSKIEASIKNLAIDERATESPEFLNGGSTKKSPPVLPPRTLGPYYINLTDGRRIRLLRELNQTLTALFGEDGVSSDEGTIVPHHELVNQRVDGEAKKREASDTDTMQLLLTYLNLVYCVKEQFLLDELKDLNERIASCVGQFTDSQIEDNNVVLLGLFNESLKVFTESKQPSTA